MIKVVCLMILVGMILSANVSAVVYDDEGKVITEEEIQYQMKSKSIYHTARYGCCLIGTCLGMPLAAAASLLPLSFTEEDMGVGYVALSACLSEIVGGVIAAKYSWKYGETLDREAAIERIKEMRRTQKQNRDKKSFIPEFRITLPLLSIGF
jgi:hypothetical protein